MPHILHAGAPLPVVRITLAVGPHIEEWYLQTGREWRRGGGEEERGGGREGRRE